MIPNLKLVKHIGPEIEPFIGKAQVFTLVGMHVWNVQ